jgi:hypothetical protein
MTMNRISVPALAFFAASLAACAQEPSDICNQYVACQQAYDEASDTGPTDVEQYEAGGLCWQSGENVETCDRQCTEGLDALKDAAARANLDVPACES